MCVCVYLYAYFLKPLPYHLYPCMILLRTQVNLFLLRVSIPVFVIYQLGIRLDLTDEEAWRTLAA